MTDIEDVYDEFLAVLKQQDVDTSFGEFTAQSGEHDAALFDLCFAAINTTVSVPAKLADLIVGWLADTDQVSDLDRADFIEKMKDRRVAASPN